MTTDRLPFALDPADLLARAPAWVGPAGALFTCREAGPDPPPVLTVAWLDEPSGAELDEVLVEELARSGAASVLVDYQPVRLNGVVAVRTLTVHREGGGVLTASEQWRLLVAGRRWTITAGTGLLDQADYGPRPGRSGSSRDGAMGGLGGDPAGRAGPRRAGGRGAPRGR